MTNQTKSILNKINLYFKKHYQQQHILSKSTFSIDNLNLF